MTDYIKILGYFEGNYYSQSGGDYIWDCPTWDDKEKQWKPGKWTLRIDNVLSCQRGYHFTVPRYFYDWLGSWQDNYIFLLEAHPEYPVTYIDATKSVAGKVRLVRPLNFSKASYISIGYTYVRTLIMQYCERGEDSDRIKLVTDALELAIAYDQGKISNKKMRNRSAKLRTKALEIDSYIFTRLLEILTGIGVVMRFPTRKPVRPLVSTLKTYTSLLSPDSFEFEQRMRKYTHGLLIGENPGVLTPGY